MLNKENERELAFLVRVDAITPMDADRLECAHVGGWHCVVGKNEFKVGDLAVYFEIDSQLPEVEPFTEMEFLKSKNYKIKSQRIRGVVSQGLLMPITAFGWKFEFANFEDDYKGIFDNEGARHIVEDESRFLTKLLGVTYAVPEDNQRKASSTDKYKKMAQRHPNIFRKGWAKWLMRREWGRRLMFLFFGKKKDKKGGWPSWVVKTNEERCQNLPFLFANQAGSKWITTEKIDGTSTTFTMRGRGRKREFYVCSHNVVFDKPDKKCFYETNVYIEMAEKYHMEEVLARMLAHNPEADFVTVQAETFGAGIQRRDYGMKYNDMRVFNVIYGYKDKTIRLNPVDGAKEMAVYGIPFVPIVDTDFELPATCEETLAFAEGASAIDGGMREGLVFRSNDGVQSFKAVSNAFLLKYHQ